MDRLKRYLNRLRDFFISAGEMIASETMYTLRSPGTLISWRVPFLDWLRISPVLNLSYGLYLVGMGVTLLMRANGSIEDGYGYAGFLYFIVFMWFGMWWFDSTMSSKFLKIYRRTIDELSDILENSIATNKDLVELVKRQEHALKQYQTPAPNATQAQPVIEPVNETP